MEVAITRYNYAAALHGMGEKKSALTEMKRPRSICIPKGKEIESSCVQFVLSLILSATIAARFLFQFIKNAKCTSLASCLNGPTVELLA